MKTLIILAHPEFEQSIANKSIISEVRKRTSGVTIRNIAELYPDYTIDVKAEQEALLKHDNIIFQYPFYWYSVPAILKLWFDNVFEYQFAYGSEGDKLKGKNFRLSFTIGGPEKAYQPTGSNHFRIEDFLKSLEQTAYLAQMHYKEPIYSYGMIFIEGVYNVKEEVVERSIIHADRLIEVL